jgi:hypothetical protein
MSSYLHEVINGVSMIPGIFTGIYWNFMDTCDLSMVSYIYIYFSIVSMIHHLFVAHYYYNFKLLRLDVISQQIVSLTILSKKGEHLYIIIIAFLSTLLFFVNFKKRKYIAYGTNAVIMFIMSYVFDFKIKIYFFICISIFLMGQILHDDFTHGLFHLFIHIMMHNIVLQLC